MMNKQEIFRKIGMIINELNEQYDYLSGHPESVNELELELFLANANFLSDHIEIIRKIKEEKASEALPESTSAPHVEFVKQTVTNIEPLIIAAPKQEEHHDEPVADDDTFTKEKPLFTFDMDAPPEDDRFDFEQKPITQIFDRQLTKEEQQIIDNKHKALFSQPEVPVNHSETAIHHDEVKAEPVAESTEAADETGEEPYLIFKEPVEKEAIAHKAPEPDKAEAIHTETPAIEKVIQQAEPNIKLTEKPIAAETAHVAEPAPVAESKSATINGVIKDEKPHQAEEAPKLTLNEILSQQLHDGAKPQGMTHLPITDLKGAINLNDKLLFVRELFNGYSLAYSEAIELLNRFDSFEAADNFLKKNYAVKNNWADKQATVDRLYELINRKFIK